jgi:hypothetical protein
MFHLDRKLHSALFRSVLAALAVFAAAAVSVTCDDVTDAILDPWDPDSCVEFHFWRNDTLLVKDLPVEVERISTKTVSGCRSQRWESRHGDSWITYDLESAILCERFDAEIHVGKRYWEVTTGTQPPASVWFAEGNWKLHEVNGDVDKIIDGGTFQFEFSSSGSCP